MKHMRLMGEADAIADCMTEVTTLKKLRDVPTVVTLRYEVHCCCFSESICKQLLCPKCI